MAQRLTPDERKSVLVKTAIRIGRELGVMSITHDNVADQCPLGSSKATVLRYFPTNTELRRAACEDEQIHAAFERIGIDL